MKRKIIIVLGIIVAVALIALAYWTISPLFIDVRVSEDMPAVTSSELARGEFVGVEGHNASGLAKILDIAGKKYLRFEEDFKVTNGPDLFVYLGKNGKYDSAVNLGSLRGNVGSQNYEIPSGINLADYDSAWVWCRAFGVGFGYPHGP